MVQDKKENKRSAKRFIAMLLSVALVASLGLALVACGGNAAPAGSESTGTAATGTASTGTESTGTEAEATPVELQIFAANSLEKALPEVQALYTSQNPHVTFADSQFKGSGDLVTELQGGAPADILITASGSTMDKAIEDGNIIEATRIDLFLNDLIVIKQAGSSVVINSLEDVMSDEISKIAIGDADAVPAGAYANQSLFTIDLYTDESGKGGEYAADFAARVVIQASVGNVAKTVSTGDAQIGFAYTSDLYRYDGIEQAFVVPSDAHKKIVYPGAVVAGSSYADEAAEFIYFCYNDPEALRIWAQFGFEVAA